VKDSTDGSPIGREVDAVSIVVANDGDGFDAEMKAMSRRGAGLGLVSVRERLLAMGGQLEITSTAGRLGVSARILVPLGSGACAKGGPK